jgi:aspartate 1-decarboxylase
MIIIISYASMELEEAENFTPWLVFPDPENKLT